MANEQTMELVPVSIGNDNELGVSRQSVQAGQEVQAAVFMAKRFPRDEDQAFAAVMKACARPSFAEQVTYSYPRGQAQVTGASVYLAREMARVWGNISYGSRVIFEDDEKQIGEAFAWDLQTNTRRTAEFKVPKLIQRKQGDSTQWVKPNERDLRELFANIAARFERECILKLMPRDYVDDAMSRADQTIEEEVKDDPDRAKKQMIVGFQKINVTPEMLGAYLGHPLGEASPAEITKLRGIWKGINAGEAKWGDYYTPPIAEGNGGLKHVGTTLKDRVRQATVAEKQNPPVSHSQPVPWTTLERRSDVFFALRDRLKIAMPDRAVQEYTAIMERAGCSAADGHDPMAMTEEAGIAAHRNLMAVVETAEQMKAQKQ